jgi:hypothetical protein
MLLNRLFALFQFCMLIQYFTVGGVISPFISEYIDRNIRRFRTIDTLLTDINQNLFRIKVAGRKEELDVVEEDEMQENFKEINLVDVEE